VLYVTTRNAKDVYPSGHILEMTAPPEGGCWKPLRAPEFAPEEIEGFKDISFNSAIAKVLNKLFDKKLTAWDVDFCIGRHPVRVKALSGNMTMAEPWHNPGWEMSFMTEKLAALVGAGDASSWMEMAVRIAVLFGIYGELLRQERISTGERVDIAVLSGSFMEPMSAWYARSWGLPIENIICCCNENNGVWDLICHGQFRTDVVSRESCVPRADIVLPEQLERLILECGGIVEMEDYLGCVRTGRTYFPSEPTLARMRKGLYVSVVSSDRLPQTISGAYGSHGYVLSPESALVYAGLQDYRSKKGKMRQAVVMTNESPVHSAELVAQALGIRTEEIKDLL